MDSFDNDIKETNARLKSAKMRVLILRRGSRLWLNATLPPKPHILNKSKPYQQSLSIGANATQAGLRYAFQKAKELATSLDSGKFCWGDWIESQKETALTIGEWVKKYHDWRQLKSELSPSTWKTDYLQPASKLPAQSALTCEILIQAISITSPDSRSRKRLCDYCCRLAKFAGMEGLEKIQELRGNYSQSSVNPRNLPTDNTIVKVIDNISNPKWQWAIAVIATYGLRNHEIFFLDMEDFPDIRVFRGKTGERLVTPLHPDWATRWNLASHNPPDINPNHSNDKLGTKVSGWFYDKDMPFTAYDLRHCFARRCLEYGVAPDVAAKLMGHGLSVHLSTYRAWVDKDLYLKAAKSAIRNKLN